MNTNQQPIYTVILIQWVNRVQYVIGSKAMTKEALDKLLAQGATLLSRHPKHERIVRVGVN